MTISESENTYLRLHTRLEVKGYSSPSEFSLFLYKSTRWAAMDCNDAERLQGFQDQPLTIKAHRKFLNIIPHKYRSKSGTHTFNIRFIDDDIWSTTRNLHRTRSSINWRALEMKLLLRARFILQSSIGATLRKLPISIICCA